MKYISKAQFKTRGIVPLEAFNWLSLFDFTAVLDLKTENSSTIHNTFI